MCSKIYCINSRFVIAITHVNEMQRQQNVKFYITIYTFLDLFYHSQYDKRYRIPKGQSKMDNSQKLASYCTQDE